MTAKSTMISVLNIACVNPLRQEHSITPLKRIRDGEGANPGWADLSHIGTYVVMLLSTSLLRRFAGLNIPTA